MATRARLSQTTLQDARQALIPTYSRRHPPSIVHLGLGSFARAHLAVYADEMIRAGWPAFVHGISLRTSQIASLLKPQDGLYTLAQREPAVTDRLRVVGSLARVSSTAASAVTAIASSSTTLVTLTVTEKGYRLSDEGGPGSSGIAPKVVAAGLAARRARGLPPPIVASLDNLLHNGSVLRDVVVQEAERTDPELARWIAGEVCFSSSVVDRMVPRPTEDDFRQVGDVLGLDDKAAVVAEQYCSWVITESPGLPPIDEVGVEVVRDLEPFERRKLWLLNGPHSAIAYGGLLAGVDLISAAAAHPALTSFIRGLVQDIIEVADIPERLDAVGYARQVMKRFSNPRLGYTCVQVGTDGSEKLLQRFAPLVAAREERGLDNVGFAAVVAIWLSAVCGFKIQGRRLISVPDPLADRLLRTSRRSSPSALVREALNLWHNEAFERQVVLSLSRLRSGGIEMLRDGASCG